jgi:selenide,water dikinase
MAVVAVTDGEAATRLTALALCGGCGAKLPAAGMLPIIRGLPGGPSDGLLVGPSTVDDAAVFRVRDDLALVQTVDFFTPLVDDPYDFGRVAAANALSDVYAMGGSPITALNIVAFPLEELGEGVLREILRGGSDVVAGAGAVVVGGHSIRDREPKYGLAVTGTVDPAVMTTNAAGRIGDTLVLTKPLGTGAIVMGRMRGCVSEEVLQEAVEVMVTLNERAAVCAVAMGVRAMTDVTGFGLLGHLHNLCLASGLAAVVDATSVPVIDGATELLVSEAGVSSGSRRNADWAAGFTDVGREVEPWRVRLLADATTSGGLLAAVPGDSAGLLPGVVVGELCAGPAGAITVR